MVGINRELALYALVILRNSYSAAEYQSIDPAGNFTTGNRFGSIFSGRASGATSAIGHIPTGSSSSGYMMDPRPVQGGIRRHIRSYIRDIFHNGDSSYHDGRTCGPMAMMQCGHRIPQGKTWPGDTGRKGNYLFTVRRRISSVRTACEGLPAFIIAAIAVIVMVLITQQRSFATEEV